MTTPSPGQIRFAINLFATELTPRRRTDLTIWPKAFELAVAVTFIFFLVM